MYSNTNYLGYNCTTQEKGTMEGKWDSLSLLYDDGDQIAYSEEDPYGQAIDDFDAYGEADGFPPIHNLDLR